MTWPGRQAVAAATVLAGVAAGGAHSSPPSAAVANVQAAAEVLLMQSAALVQVGVAAPVASPAELPTPATPDVAGNPTVAGDTTTSRPPVAAELSARAFGGAVRVLRKPTPVPVPVKAPAPPVPAVADPMPIGQVTSCFGPRWGRLHAGVDIAAAHGSPVVAVAAGTVVSAGAVYGGYGISVLIAHPDGYLTHYAHLSAVAVSPGDTVRAGARLGAEGSTGNSTGPHLHFEVHQGTFTHTVDPTVWLRERGIDRGCAS